MMWALWIATAIQMLAALFSGWRARRSFREYRTLKGLNQIVWAYAEELRQRGVTLPPRCVMCCQILPGHVDGCQMEDAYKFPPSTLPRIKYYPKGEKPPEYLDGDPHA